jgi:hypothetical protein
LKRWTPAIAALAAALAVGGCSTAIDVIPAWVGGEPTGTPERPLTSAEYPPVNDRPPPRETKLITQQEQGKLESELTAARAKQAATAEETQKDRTEVLANTPQWNADRAKAAEIKAAAAKNQKTKDKPKNASAN